MSVFQRVKNTDIEDDSYPAWELFNLGRMTYPVALELYRKSLNDKNSLAHERRRILNVFMQLGDDGRVASKEKDIADIGKALNDPDASVRSEAASALGSIGQQWPKQTIPLLIQSLKDKELSVRNSAVFALGMFGADAEANCGAGELS